MDKNNSHKKIMSIGFWSIYQALLKNEITDAKIEDGGGGAFYIFLKKINL